MFATSLKTPDVHDWATALVLRQKHVLLIKRQVAFRQDALMKSEYIPLEKIRSFKRVFIVFLFQSKYAWILYLRYLWNSVLPVDWTHSFFFFFFPEVNQLCNSGPWLTSRCDEAGQ